MQLLSLNKLDNHIKVRLLICNKNKKVQYVVVLD